MDLENVKQITTPLLHESYAQALDALSRAKNGDPLAMQEFQFRMNMFNAWFTVNTEMITLFKTLSLQSTRAINA